MWLKRKAGTVCRSVIAISVPLLLVSFLASCSSTNQANPIEPQADSSEEEQVREDEGLGETSRAVENSSQTVPAPTQLGVSIVRAGYVSLQWTPSNGDTVQHHPGADTVSYYRIYRNGELLTKSFSASIEDTNPPQGKNVYGVQAVKYSSAGEYSVTGSMLQELDVFVPTIDMESNELSGLQINKKILDERLNSVQNCVTAVALVDGSTLCSNHLGHTWPVSLSGVPGNLLNHTSSVNDSVLVSVSNHEADMGPVPAVPSWSVTQLSTNKTEKRDLHLESELRQGERVLVNGVAVASDHTVFVSGTVYQSYIPRSLGPGPGILPVTSGYFVAKLDIYTGGLILFKRFTLSESPGTVASLSNGRLQMFQTGQVTFLDPEALESVETVRVTGTPVFASNMYVYTQSVDSEPSTEYFRFML